MDRKVRIGVIGTSWWMDLMYVPSLLSHPDAEIVAVCGRDEAKAAAVASKFGDATVFTDYRQLIANGHCDAVIVATPDDSHAEITLAAIDAGLHVLCEKPLAGHADDALRMHRRATEAGVISMVMFTWRWQPHWRYVKQLLDNGYVGRCRYAELKFLGGFALDPGYKWRFDGRRANGVTGDLGSHMIDFAQWYLGEVTAVRADLPTFVDQTALSDQPSTPANDLGLVSLKFADGARAQIVASAINILGDEGVRISAAFYGDEGTLEIERPYFGVRAGATLRGVRKGDASATELKVPPELLEGGVDPLQLFDPYLKQSAGPRMFIDAILTKQQPEPDFAIGVRVQEIVDAALLSFKEDRWVGVAEPRPAAVN